MSKKYIVSTASTATYFHPLPLNTGLAKWGGGSHLGTCCETPIILEQIDLVSNQFNHCQNWQELTRNIVECHDLLFGKVQGCMFPCQRLKFKTSFSSSWLALFKISFSLEVSKTTSLRFTPPKT